MLKLKTHNRQIAPVRPAWHSQKKIADQTLSAYILLTPSASRGWSVTNLYMMTFCIVTCVPEGYMGHWPQIGRRGGGRVYFNRYIHIRENINISSLPVTMRIYASACLNMILLAVFLMPCHKYAGEVLLVCCPQYRPSHEIMSIWRTDFRRKIKIKISTIVMNIECWKALGLYCRF